jgi:hypothetical protein
MSDLEVRVAVLEKLLDRALDALVVSKISEKTAEKALAMAQEAIAVAMGMSKPESAPDPLEAPPIPSSSSQNEADSGRVENRVGGILARLREKSRKAPEVEIEEKKDLPFGAEEAAESTEIALNSVENIL